MRDTPIRTEPWAGPARAAVGRTGAPTVPGGPVVGPRLGPASGRPAADAGADAGAPAKRKRGRPRKTPAAV
jgi:hypothetical protein